MTTPIERTSEELADYLDDMYSRIDKMMWADQWDEIDNELIDSMASNPTDIHEMVGYLTITACGSHKLKHRHQYFIYCKNRITELGRDNVDSLLVGLEK